jgi:hypothetical protein
MEEWILAARLILGGVWLAAGAAKIRQHTSLTELVQALGPVPAPVARALSAVAPWVELALGAALLSGWGAAAAAGVSLVLLLSFAVGFGRLLRRGVRLSCNCFGKSDDPISYFDLVRNLWLAGLASACLVPGQNLRPFEPFGTLAAAAVLGICMIVFQQIKELARIGGHIKNADNDVFLDYYGSKQLVELARRTRIDRN